MKKYLKYILFIPIINVIADSLQGYTSGGILSPGFLRTYFIITLIFFSFKYFNLKEKISKYILLSLFYFALLLVFSTNRSYSFSIYLKYAISALMFMIGYTYIKNFSNYFLLLRNLMFTLAIYTVFIIFSTIFGLGSAGYSDNVDINFGVGRVNMTKAMGLLSVISPLILRYEKRKRRKTFAIIILVLAIIFIFIGVKRTVIIGLPLSFIIYFLLTPFKQTTTKALLYLSVILVALSPLYLQMVTDSFQTRIDSGRFDPEQAEEEEARVVEIFRVLDKFNSDNIFNKFFGEEIFNSAKSFNTVRMLHTDYAVMFSGTGLLGFFLFLFIHYLLFKKSYYYYKDSNPEIKNMAVVSLSLLVYILLVSISGSVTTLSIRSLSYLFWGATFGYLDYIKNNMVKIKKI